MIIQIGELRNQLSLDLQRNIEAMIRKPNLKKLDRYYIFVYSRKDLENPNIIRTKLIATKRYVPPIVGGILLEVNNKEGRLRSKYILPLDFPKLEAMMDEKGGDERIIKSAQFVPIIH